MPTTNDAPIELEFSRLAGDGTSPRLLLLGPSLGTSVSALWRECAKLLTDVEVLGWDLPGHGRGRPASGEFRVEDLAAAVRSRASEIAANRRVAYAGVSLGGAVGFALALEPGLVERVITIASAPGGGHAQFWNERAALVRRAGTAQLVEGAASRWFAPGFAERSPDVARELLSSLADADDASYALACEALAQFDLGARMSAARIPVHSAVGEHDKVVPPRPGVDVFKGCAHLPPAEDPHAVAAYLVEKGLAA
jgi:pimeloyl-ACP methyl ester carboxylesterase